MHQRLNINLDAADATSSAPQPPRATTLPCPCNSAITLKAPPTSRSPSSSSPNPSARTCPSSTTLPRSGRRGRPSVRAASARRARLADWRQELSPAKAPSPTIARGTPSIRDPLLHFRRPRRRNGPRYYQTFHDLEQYCYRVASVVASKSSATRTRPRG